MDSSIISILIVLITMGLFIWNKLPISVVAIASSLAMALFLYSGDAIIRSIQRLQRNRVADGCRHVHRQRCTV